MISLGEGKSGGADRTSCERHADLPGSRVGAAAPDAYTGRRLLLRFHDDAMEDAYIDHTLQRTMTYCRFSWAIVIVLGGSFGLLDRRMFGDQANTVLALRFALVVFAVGVLGVAFITSMRRLMVWSSAVFILLVGGFSIALTALSNGSEVVPYFTGLMFAFVGVFTTAGIGFTRSLGALLAVTVAFEAVIGVFAPVDTDPFLVYSLFVVGAFGVFAFAGYLVERTARESFAVSEQLRESLEQVAKLDGLLPICAACKKIRDDKGYWSQIEAYISSHSEARFSHGLCPGCVVELYPEIADDILNED
jgi:hypothetical protein